MPESEELKKAAKRILSKHNVALKEDIRHNLPRVAGDFRAQGLIEQDMVDAVSDVVGIAPFPLAAKVVNACQTMLGSYPQEKFPGFIAGLKNYDTTERLAEEMEAEFKKAGGKMPNDGGSVKLAMAGQVAASPSSTGGQVLNSKPGVHPEPVSKAPNAQQLQPQDLIEVDSAAPEEHQEEQQLRKRGYESSKQVYHMEKKPHGRAVIFNFIEDYPDAAGVTVEKFKDTFKSLGYRVHEYPFLSEEDMKRSLTEGIKSEHDSFVCCIMAHGDRGIITAKDKKVEIHDLQMEVVEKCPELFGKPKIFIIQACRGKHAHIPLDESQKKPTQLSREADFYIAYSTTEGHIAVFDEEDGCLYINTLCKIFKESAGHLTLDEMVMEVHEELKEEVADVQGKGKHIEMGQVVHTLRGPVRF